MQSDYASLIDTIYETLHPIIVEKDSIREQLLKLSREATRKAGAAINACIRGDFEKSRTLLNESQKVLTKIHIHVSHHIEFQGWGALDIAEQEYVEGMILLAIRSGYPLPTYEELEVSPLSYTYGIADAANELRRVALHLLLDEKVDDARDVVAIMEHLYEMLLAIGDFSKGVLPQLRKKVDTLRMLLERTEADLFRAVDTTRIKQFLASRGSSLPSIRRFPPVESSESELEGEPKAGSDNESLDR